MVDVLSPHRQYAIYDGSVDYSGRWKPESAMSPNLARAKRTLSQGEPKTRSMR
jgi:hypothetical protein